MEGKLPDGWIKIPFSETVSSKKGKKPRILSSLEFEESIPYLDIKALEKKEVRQFADKGSSVLLNDDEIAIVWDGARSGWVAKGVKGALGSTLAALSPIKIDRDSLVSH